MFWIPVLIAMIYQEPVPAAGESAKAIFERAAKAPDADMAGITLSRLLKDEATLRSAYELLLEGVDERSMYVFFQRSWDDDDKFPRLKHEVRRRIEADIMARKPELIRLVIRSDRYWVWLRRHSNVGGSATINSFPFFEHATYVDDLIERFIEQMRDASKHPAEPLVAFGGDRVMVRPEVIEMNLLATWQLMCGVCDRLDLIENATLANWRGRFPELEAWFLKNRPYFLWDEVKGCIAIDEEARDDKRPTRRHDRSVPLLKPTWKDPRE